MKRIKRGAVERYIKKNPLAPASLVAKETGCHSSTVYLARKRLGLPTTMKEQNALLFDAVSHKKPEVKTTVVIDESMTYRITELQSKLDAASGMIKSLGVLVGVLVLAFAFTLTK